MTQHARTPWHRYVALAVLATATAMSALPAQAQRYGHGGDRGRPHYDNRYDNRGYRGNGRDRRGGGGHGGLIAGALIGVIAGAAISNASQRPPPGVVYSAPPPPPPPGVVYYDNNGY